MLEVAKERHSRNGLVNVEFVKASAEFLPYREAHFDCVVISFGLRNMADYEKVLRQIFQGAEARRLDLLSGLFLSGK